MELAYEHDAVVVVAGVPGAGKSTLIRRAVDRTAAAVVDTDDERERGRGGRLLYARHYVRIAAAVLGARPVVVHSRGTRAPARRAVALLARLRGRPAHLLLLDADRPAAEAGQRRRGRVLGARRHGPRVVALAAPAGPRRGGRGLDQRARAVAPRGGVGRPPWSGSRARRRLQWRSHIPPGTTGFDAVGSWGRLRAEVPEASLNPGNNHKCGR